MKWHHVLLTAVIAIVAVVAFVYIFAPLNVPVVSVAAKRLGGGG